MRKVWKWECPEEVLLSNGVVMLAVSVPPYAYADLHSEMPPPPSPMVDLTSSITGNTETVKALKESPEWIEYTQQRLLYQRKMTQRTSAFRLDYGCLGWRYPDTEEWVDEAPKDYTPPEAMKRWGIEVEVGDAALRRIAWLKYVLIRTDADDDGLQEIWEGKRPPEKKEVTTVPFESSTPTEPQSSGQKV